MTRRVARAALVAVCAVLALGALPLGVLPLDALPPSTASAQVPEDTPLRVRWTWPGPVTFCADTSLLPQGVTASAFRSWVQEAMDAWNRVDADVELRLDPQPCIRAPDNRRNEVGFEVYGDGLPEVGRAYSVTDRGEPVEGDVTLRADWDTQPHCRVSALVHEFGHVLGFTHSEFETDVMGYGPCAVLQPSTQEEALLAAAYGPRPAPLTLATAPPQGAPLLALETVQVAYPAQAGAYYYNAFVTVADGGARVLRLADCFTPAGVADAECVEESSLPYGFWPVALRTSPLAEVPQTARQSVVEPASAFGHFARPLRACNAVGCTDPFEVRAGDVRVSGTGVDFAYLAYPAADGGVAVQVANVSFFAPPTFLDVPATFEVRRRGVAGAAGLLGACTVRLGEVCEVAGLPGGQDLAIVVWSAGVDARTGVWMRGVAARPGAGLPSGSTLVSGTLPASGYALVSWGGGPVTQAAADPRLGAIFVSRGGVFVGYVVGAPAFVNATFLAEVGTDLPAGTPVVVVVR